MELLAENTVPQHGVQRVLNKMESYVPEELEKTFIKDWIHLTL